MFKKIVMGSLLLVLVGGLVLGVGGLGVRPVSAAPEDKRGVPGRPTDRSGNRLDGWSLPVAEPGTLDEAEVDALVEAISDEYKALATYQTVVDTFGAVQPFTRIIRAEQQHIAALERLFVRYGVEIPANEWYGRVPEFDSVIEACQAGVEAELDNAALYDHLFAAVDEPDIIQVFTRLQDASQYNHLPAFETCSG
jgi:hypothetical protein